MPGIFWFLGYCSSLQLLTSGKSPRHFVCTCKNRIHFLHGNSDVSCSLSGRPNHFSECMPSRKMRCRLVCVFFSLATGLGDASRSLGPSTPVSASVGNDPPPPAHTRMRLPSCVAVPETSNLSGQKSLHQKPRPLQCWTTSAWSCDLDAGSPADYHGTQKWGLHKKTPVKRRFSGVSMTCRSARSGVTQLNP